MIAKDKPLNAIEKPGLLRLLKITVPLYKPPKRKHLTKLMDQKFEVMVVIVKIIIKENKMYVINCRHLDRFTYHYIIFRNNCTFHRFELFLSILKFIYSINHIYILF